MKPWFRLIGVLVYAPAGFAISQVTGLSGWNIYIDPGHSQKQNMGIYGYSEAEKNLGVGLHFRDLLLNRTDIGQVFMSRTNGQQNVGLSQRAYDANSKGAAWFHSHHSDASAPQYNSTLMLWGQYDNGSEKTPKGGQEMSDIMVEILTDGMRTTSRGSIGDCSFYTWSDWCAQSGGPYLAVNRLTDMPSELSEAGFHTNPRQNQLNMNDRWKRLEAWTFFWSILEYHNIQRPAVGICAGIVTDLESRRPINGATLALNGQNDTTDTFESLFHKYTQDPMLLSNGFYYFEDLPNDTLDLIVEASGYYSDTLNVVINESFFTFMDPKLISKVPPQIIRTVPQDGDSLFPAWDDIILDFSRQMNRTSIETGFTILPAATGELTWMKDDTRLIFRGDSLRFETSYTITIPGSGQDVYGHSIDGNGDGIGGDAYTWSFRTGSEDMSPPRLVDIYPPQVGREIERRLIINMVFDEPLEPASISSGSFTLERNTDHTTIPGILEHYQFTGQSILSYFPSEILLPGEVYVSRVFAGLQDLFGNTISSNKAFSFRTHPSDSEIKVLDALESDLVQNWWELQQSGSTTGIVTDSTRRVVNTSVINHLTGSSAALQIDYAWDPNASSWLIREYLGGGSPRSILFDEDYHLRLYVFGDGSGNKFRFAVDDHAPTSGVAGYHEVSPWFTIDWLGWRLLSWDMKQDGTGTWIGDGMLDGALRFDSIQLTYEPGSKLAGTLIFDDLHLAKETEVGIDVSEMLIPVEFILRQNYPNPFNPNTTLEYGIPYDGEVTLRIYNSSGEFIRTLEQGFKSAGVHHLGWDGRNERGHTVSSGVYIYKLVSGSYTATRRMLLVK